MVRIGRRRSADYRQVVGYVRKPLVVRFKTFCTAQEREISEVLEDLIDRWVTEQERGDNTGGTNTVVAFLRALAQDKRPSDAECVAVAREAGVSEELTLKLRDRFFDTK
jgi:hypothetical protein